MADYSNQYSEEDFWDKVITCASSAGREVIKKALTLYYALVSDKTPLWAKVIIIAALGYFIAPIDAIPDVIPIAGYSDDIGVLATAIANIIAHINSDIIQRAEEKTNEIF